MSVTYNLLQPPSVFNLFTNVAVEIYLQSPGNLLTAPATPSILSNLLPQVQLVGDLLVLVDPLREE